MTVLVIGLAETGVAVARAMRAAGRAVLVVEDAPSATDKYAARVAEVLDAGADLVEAPAPGQIATLLDGVDLVVPSPLVAPGHPLLVAAAARGIAVRSEIDVAAERAAVPIVAITGTNGKTTVTTMIAAMLDASGVTVIAAGNLGRPLIDAVGDPALAAGAGVIVAEVSSFQLEFAGAAFRPRVAVLLAITPDHLDWHGSFAAYAAAKARITEHQRHGPVGVRRRRRASHRGRAYVARAHGRGLGARGCRRVLPGRRRRARLPGRSGARADLGDGPRPGARPHECARGGRGGTRRGRRPRRRHRHAPRVRDHAPPRRSRRRS